MSYTISEEKKFSNNQQAVAEAIKRVANDLGGKLVKKGKVECVVFSKKMLGKVLGEQTRVEYNLESSDSETTVKITAYPLDAIGNKLMFGARKGVTRQVVDHFFEYLAKNL